MELSNKGLMNYLTWNNMFKVLSTIFENAIRDTIKFLLRNLIYSKLPCHL